MVVGGGFYLAEKMGEVYEAYDMEVQGTGRGRGAVILMTDKGVRQVFSEVDFPPTMIQFFDLDSDELLDEKIRVLTALKDGKQIADIPNFYDILELYPKDGEHWD